MIIRPISVSVCVCVFWKEKTAAISFSLTHTYIHPPTQTLTPMRCLDPLLLFFSYEIPLLRIHINVLSVNTGNLLSNDVMA